MRKLILPTLAVLTAGLLTAAYPAQDSRPAGEKTADQEKEGEFKPYTVGRKIDRPISLKDISGRTHELAKLRGKTVVLDFWSIQCPWSVGYEARLKKLHETYSKKGVVFLAIDSNHTEVDADEEDPYGRIKKYVKDEEIPYTVLIDGQNVVADMFAAKTTPHIYIIDGKGVLRYVGGIDDDPKGEKGREATNYVAQALDEIMAGKEVSMPNTRAKGCSIKRVKAAPQ